MRSNLLSLQKTAELFDRTQIRLSTGKKVNSALDDPVNYFAAKGHMSRASDLAALKDMMNEAIQTVKAADAGLSAIESLIHQAKSIAQSALQSNDATVSANLAEQYSEILTQIDNVAADSGYRGTNLIDSGTDNLVVVFNEDGTSTLTITHQNATSAGLGINAPAGNWANDTDIQTSISELDAAIVTLRQYSQTLSSNLSVVQTRLDFTNNMVNTITKGAENLTLADMNEEGANLLMLQTRQALSVTALSLASQAAQSVLRLF